MINIVTKAIWGATALVGTAVYCFGMHNNSFTGIVLGALAMGFGTMFAVIGGP